MNKEIAKEWVAVLRSGIYKQAIGRLKKEDGYCCLGVLCLIAKEKGAVDIDFVRSDDGGCYFYFDEAAADNPNVGITLLPKSVIDWAGMSSWNGNYPTGILSGDNDAGKTFAEIADIIEQNVEAL